MITYNNIVTALNNFADNHFFIKAFTHGNIEEMDLEKDGSYPLMHLVYLGANYDEGTKDYNFEIYLVDIPPTKVDKVSYQREVISNLEQCVEDLLADLSNGFSIFNENFHFDTENASLTPLEEEGSNVLSGVALDITISVPYTHDSCNAPLTGVTPTSGACEDATIKATEGDDDLVTITTVASGATYTFSKIAIKQQDAATIGYGRIAKAIKVTNANITAVTETATDIELTILSSAQNEDQMVKGNVLPCGGYAHTNSYNSTTIAADKFYGVPFWVGGEFNVTHIGIQSSASMAHNIVGGIYKYVYASDSWTKVAQVGPFTQAVTGMQSIALGSTEELEQGVYMMAMLGDGAQTNITGHYTTYLQNLLPAFNGGSNNLTGFYLYNTTTYSATLPATFASGDLSIWPYAGHLVPSCYLTLG